MNFNVLHGLILILVTLSACIGAEQESELNAANTQPSFIPTHISKTCEIVNDGCNEWLMDREGKPVRALTQRSCSPSTWFQQGCVKRFDNAARDYIQKTHAHPEPDLPKNCVAANDGCNSCGVKQGVIQGCTKLGCLMGAAKKPVCTKTAAVHKALPSQVAKNCHIYFDGCQKYYTIDGKFYDPNEPIGAKPNQRCDAVAGGCVSYYSQNLNDTRNVINIPAGCTSWYDGCNSCVVENGAIVMCTQRSCGGNFNLPKCTSFE